MEKMLVEMEELLHAAEKLVTSENSTSQGMQVIVVLTAKSHSYSFVNHNVMGDDLTDEKNFIDGLVERGETEIKYLVCMWQKYMLDIPSQHMRELLMKLNPLNKEMYLLLMGTEGYVIKKLKDIAGCDQ